MTGDVLWIALCLVVMAFGVGRGLWHATPDGDRPYLLGVAGGSFVVLATWATFAFVRWLVEHVSVAIR